MDRQTHCTAKQLPCQHAGSGRVFTSVWPDHITGSSHCHLLLPQRRLKEPFLLHSRVGSRNFFGFFSPKLFQTIYKINPPSGVWHESRNKTSGISTHFLIQITLSYLWVTAHTFYTLMLGENFWSTEKRCDGRNRVPDLATFRHSL